MNELIDRYLNTYRQEIIDQTCKLIQIPSVRSGATEQYPYGTQCAQALDFCMRLARRKGLAVQNYDYYCVRADLSPATEGRQILFAAHADVVPTDLHIQNGRAVLNLRLYFTEHMERVRQRLTQLLERSGLEAEVEYAGEGFQLPAGDMVVQLLTELYNRESGTRYAPYVMRRGMTYARKFPYACGFGAGNPVERKPFAPGYGTCHGPDEAHSIRTLIHAVRIYIKAIWKLDTWDWDVPERRIHHV